MARLAFRGESAKTVVCLVSQSQLMLVGVLSGNKVSEFDLLLYLDVL